MRIALDAMGGDLAPVEPVRAAVETAHEFGIEVALVGPPEILAAELKKYRSPRGVTIVPSDDTIGMDVDNIVRAVRQHPEASVNVAMALVRDGEADAVVSAGNSGAVVASAFFVLGRMPGIERPALGTVIPYKAGRIFLIDAGANADCRPSHLLQFAEMGAAYMEKVVGVQLPRIGLLSNGEEASKGNELTVEAHELLRASSLNFIGNVEGVNVHEGVCDVVVTDGFTGNVALKVGEGIADYILEQVRNVIKSNPLFLSSAILLKPALRKALKSLQYEEYGGANLLGVNGICVIAHGRSDSVAIKNALRFARAAAGSGLMDAMRATFTDTKADASPAAETLGS